MQYEPEDLLPVVGKLAKKYTSAESSSIPYEVASMLMEAVIYCINEFEQTNEMSNLPVGEQLLVEQVYQEGYQSVINKVKLAKDIYHNIIKDFEDYGCHNYKDTIVKGMSGFFVRYDAQFNPQNHILTLDYPTLTMSFEKCGIDIIYDYLTAIEIEKHVLDLFDTQAIISLLKRIQPDYKSIYLDNICYPVLLVAIGCAIVDKSIVDLSISAQDCLDIKFYFEGDSFDKVELKIRSILSLILKKLSNGMKNSKINDYFLPISHEYAARIWVCLQEGTLEHLFYYSGVVS